MANAADWEDAALAAIADHGLASLSIPALAVQLGVTKGSFYWHFKGLPQLIEASLRRWEEIDREALDEVHEIADPRARLKALFTQAMKAHQAHALYMALSPSADAKVGTILRRIHDRRLRFLVEAFRDIGLVARDAREQALLTYSAYIGAIHLRQHLHSEKDLAAYIAHAVKTLIPSVSEGRTSSSARRGESRAHTRPGGRQRPPFQRRRRPRE
jgi:AcrR family transcriptional regulator